MDLLAVVMMLVLCRYCSAHGGCTPPAGSNLISGHGKLINGIPQQNRGGPGSEFNIQALVCFLHWLFQSCEESLEAME